MKNLMVAMVLFFSLRNPWKLHDLDRYAAWNLKGQAWVFLCYSVIIGISFGVIIANSMRQNVLRLHPRKKLSNLLLGLNFLLNFGSCLPKFGICYFVLCSPVFCCNSESCEVSNEPDLTNLLLWPRLHFSSSNLLFVSRGYVAYISRISNWVSKNRVLMYTNPRTLTYNYFKKWY